MRRAVAVLSLGALLAATIAPASDRVSDVLADHDFHPGLGHPAEHDAGHRHGDEDDHHETPDSPCHHHDSHTCCTNAPMLALADVSVAFDAPLRRFIPAPWTPADVPPTARELFHVPLA
jgi:hypothetical protein